MSIRTMKIKYTVSSDLEKDTIKSFRKNYTNVLRFTYNRVIDYMNENDCKPSTKELTSMQHKMNNIFIDSHFLNSAIFEAKGLSKDKSVIFGGKKNFLERCSNKITNEQWKELSIMPICSIGESVCFGNRKFRILSENTILFQPNRDTKIELHLPSLRKGWKKDLLKLMSLQNSKSAPITYRLGKDYIYISFENNKVEQLQKANKVKDRVFSIDMNPNYMGWTVTDWQDSKNHKVIDSGVVSNKCINDWDDSLNGKGIPKDDPRKKHITNKRRYENIDTASYLVSKAIHYGCEIFAIEKLDFSKENKKGRSFNRLCRNQWCRDIFVNQLQKKCDLANIKLQEVLANYSSFVGNLAYRKEDLPDMCLSSIEIGRRGYEFYHQYILKDKDKTKNIVFDNSEKTKEAISISLEELGMTEEFKDIQSMFALVKTRKMRYRVPIENSKLKIGFSKKSTKSKVILYNLL